MIMKAPVWLGVVLLVTANSCLANTRKNNPCALHPTRHGWHVFVDQRDGFCFEYPPKYRKAPAVYPPDYVPDPKTRFIGRLTTKLSQYESADPDVATIDVYDEGYPFRLEDLIKFSPIGDVDNAPPLIHAAHADFYYCGPGGGGVNYPDDFFFGIRGDTFSISFYGPYKDDKTPDGETKRIEPEVLASFRRF